ncbi:hypothetical protein Flavo103_37900 [Flavobacterium collinsii]|jgi:hypothetical protein|uniref:Uncharacterized protein n=1 Tax=Flavobacterium collinsii TaxID=1114861 RepID=A0A9W4X533_9FLAO|nr:hypothetical protein Flavo103_37900 [Flavobacterium collinsii]CAA9195381.1 hypothetical protein FLACOL7796_00608 [Flavobacterium collinsii]CAI2768828.1 conserved protein of unknown function [Flavobacterium collinsii]
MVEKEKSKKVKQKGSVFKILFCIICLITAIMGAVLFENLLFRRLSDAIIILALLNLIRLLSGNNIINLIITHEKHTKNSIN